MSEQSRDFSPVFMRSCLRILQDYGITVTGIVESRPNPTKYMLTAGMDVLIYLTEEVEGIFLLSMPYETALGLTKRVDMDPESVDEELSREFISEAGNLIAGRAVAVMQKEGMQINITPPSIFCGVGSRIFSLVPNLMVTDIHTEVGPLKIFCAVRQKEKQVIYV